VLFLASCNRATSVHQLNSSKTSAPLTLVARFDHQVTGVAVTPDARVFVNFPRWTEDTAVSVAELGQGGKLAPYPNSDWNAWHNDGELSPENHFVCVQSVVADRHGHLWILDPGSPAIATIVKGAPKLVEVDLSTNRIVKVIPFGEEIAPQGSYINDIRFTPDSRFGFLSDAGARGALLVVDLESGKGGPQRLRDVACRQNAKRYLIQERLEGLMIPAIDQNHVDWLTGECFRGAQSGESTANDHDLFPQSMLQSILYRHCLRPGSRGSVACRDDSARLC
jgi:hypothetical protein